MATIQRTNTSMNQIFTSIKFVDDEQNIISAFFLTINTPESHQNETLLY